ncbi:AAA family ATPase [Marinobacter sp. JSM 1782161]|uniref:AAA family ATPase n=1 Tax=Marinobacter sp. JSM 1782161 TaxID=2685906 RepID=UPI0014024B56|nr:AAA family ATPase [Marinobacter sp. JSM 1782161]
MIAGLFLRDIKCYSNLNFVPFIKDNNENLNILIGGNGAGKSTLLESINCILNNVDPKSWETTIGQKKSRSQICPVFLIPKEKLKPDPKIEAISNAFWSNDFTVTNQSESTKEFQEWRDDLRKKVDPAKYFLISIGKNYEGSTILTSTFHKKIFDQTKRAGVSKTFINDLFSTICKLYSYIYIPVESRMNDVLSLQAHELQSLMDKSVIQEIRSILEKKEHTQNQGTKKISLVDIINQKLDGYIEDINKSISEGYKFEPKGAHKKTIKPNDILKIVLSEYFSIRPLTKDGKNINSLSSGQQRLALIDVATTLLSSENEKSKEIIVAIDEPESSLESKQRFNQFIRLIKISEKHQHQVFLTTHWYGLLLRPSKGRLHFIEEEENLTKISNFNMESLFDNRRSFPDSIEMKSYFDLMSSLLTVIKTSAQNWIICEGAEDARYLDTYLSNKVENLNILPFNGCGNVKKIFDFLSVPFSDKAESKNIQGKVLCLIDTDAKSTIVINGYSSKNYDKKLQFSRLSLDRESQKSSIISVASTNSINTEIEDLLDPKIMWQSIQKTARKDNDLNRVLKHFRLNSNAKYSDLTGRMSMFKFDSMGSHQNKDRLKNLLATDKVKRELSHAYRKIAGQESLPSPDWAKQIIDFFEN